MADSAAHLEPGVFANRVPPELDTHDRFGNRVDLEYRARDVTDRMALAIQASLLVQHARRSWRTRSARRAWPPPGTTTTGPCPAAWTASR